MVDFAVLSIWRGCSPRAVSTAVKWNYTFEPRMRLFFRPNFLDELAIGGARQTLLDRNFSAYPHGVAVSW